MKFIYLVSKGLKYTVGVQYSVTTDNIFKGMVSPNLPFQNIFQQNGTPKMYISLGSSCTLLIYFHLYRTHH